MIHFIIPLAITILFWILHVRTVKRLAASNNLNYMLEERLRWHDKPYNYKPLSADHYQFEALKTAVFPDKYKIIYPTLGLCDEAGEVLGKIKKHLRGDYELTPERKIEIAKEVGDVMWYTAALARDLGFRLSQIQDMNLKKLSDRNNRGVIKGDGDNR